MTQFLREAGTMIFLMLVTGPVAIGYAAAFAWRPDVRRRRVALGVLKATTWIGFFGFTAGMCGTLYAYSMSGQLRILLEGMRESANNVLLAAVYCAVVFLLSAVGDARLQVTD